jgi:hypothetical protein
MIRLIRTLVTAVLLAAAATLAWAAPQDVGIDYDIVYVRYARDGDNNSLTLPSGEQPYYIHKGGDLVLLHPDGSQDILVGCRDDADVASYLAEQSDTDVNGNPASAWPDCSVQDPVVSVDGEWVYYAKYTNVTAGSSDNSWIGMGTPTFIFKMKIEGAGTLHQEIQLTNDTASGYENDRYAGNSFPADRIPSGVRDLGPALLPNGDIVFTSNRSGLIPGRHGTNTNINPTFRMQVDQLYRMSDHDGSEPNKNLRVIGRSVQHLAQHPTVLHDGRVLFANWDDPAMKYRYGMLTLYTINPDGSDIRMFMEPHDFHKRLDHFPTQLASGDTVHSVYYVGASWGFGYLLRSPTAGHIPEWQEDQLDGEDHYRKFARVGTVNMTPHTNGTDKGSPNGSGRYSTPSAAPENAMLVAFSSGPVDGGELPMLDSGIYLVPNATTVVVTDPGTQVLEAINSPDFNEVWPRAVTPYVNIHGIAAPAIVPEPGNDGTVDARLPAGTPFGLFGSSSVYNRESAPIDGDPFWLKGSRETTTGGDGYVQGAQAGRFTNADIWGVRLVQVVPKPYFSPYTTTAYEERVLYDDRVNEHVFGFASHANERWRILGEFPVHHDDGQGGLVCNGNEPMIARNPDGTVVDYLNPYITSPSGPCGLNTPDSSFLAKVPGHSLVEAQLIDQNGMTLAWEQTWREVIPGEKRIDCDGCHGHALPPISFAGTRADQPDYAVWDVATKTPLADGAGGVAYKESGGQDVGTWGPEFFADIAPLLAANCTTNCHAQAAHPGTDLVFDDPTDDAYWRLARDTGAKYGGGLPSGATSWGQPQYSKYVRAFQARSSLLIWRLWEQRLDGRANGDRSDDIDYGMSTDHSGFLTDDEKRTFGRWVDIGVPEDLPGRTRNTYTEDDILPTVAPDPHPTTTAGTTTLKVGFFDGDSGIDTGTFDVTATFSVTGYPAGTDLAPLGTYDATGGILTITLPEAIPNGVPYAVTATAFDLAGNRDTVTEPVVAHAASGGGEGPPHRPFGNIDNLGGPRHWMPTSPVP